MLLKMKERIGELISLFRNEISSLDEFYGQIFRAYTMDTDLYPLLNSSLRNENWIEVDKLLPYAFCLCKAFFNRRLKTDSSQDNQISPSMLLYRGTAFDEKALSFYDKNEVQNFSWNAVTSTSTDKRLAEDFMYKNADLVNKKYPVMFVIEVPPETEFNSENLKWIDIRQYSAIPKEDEVILAPGSVFELQEIVTDQNKMTTIKMKLRSEIKSLAYRGMMMQGALQSQMATEKETKIICLEGEELDQALMSKHGNKLIEEIEFCLCTFDNKSLIKMFEALPKLEKARKLKFIACMFQDHEERTFEELKKGERCEITKIEVIEANDFFQRVCNEKWNQEYWVNLREVDLDFRGKGRSTDEELNQAVSQRFKYLPQLTHLSLNFEHCSYIKDTGFQSLTKGLSSLTQLRDLNLNFELCLQLTNEGAYSLAKEFTALNQLTHLNLNFGCCWKINEKGVESFANSLNSLTQLSHLTFRFGYRPQITYKGRNSLTKLLNSLTQLTHLNLDLRGCIEIAKEEIDCLAKGLDSLTKLTHLNMTFNEYMQMSDEAVKSLAKSFNSLSQLRNLRIDFQRCGQITNDGMNILSQVINSLTQLTHLDLNYGWCSQIADEGVRILAKGLNSLTQLTHLHLSFEECKQIASETVSILISQGLKSLTQLTSLILDFDGCEQITGQDLHILAGKWLKHLTSLKSPIVQNQRLQNIDTPSKNFLVTSRLKLAREIPHEEKKTFFAEVSSLEMTPIISESSDRSKNSSMKLLSEKIILICGKNQDLISDPASTLEISEIISEIYHLNSLVLNFKQEEKITDEFLHNLSSQVLSNLMQLRSLTLIFRDCETITDRGVSDLASYGLKSLTNLAFLKLDFYGCGGITNKGIADLALKGFKHLSQLKSLALNFSYCNYGINKELMNFVWLGLGQLSQLEVLALTPNGIKDKGVDDLASHALQYLTQLKFLALDFSETKITDQGMNNLILRIVKKLPKLTVFDLNFYDCLRVSDSSVRNIIKVLDYFGFTKEIETKTLIDWNDEDSFISQNVV